MLVRGNLRDCAAIHCWGGTNWGIRELCPGDFDITTGNTVHYLLRFWSPSSQEISRILWNTKVHYRIHKGPPPIPFPSQIKPVHAPAFHFSKINFNIILPSKSSSSKWSVLVSTTHQTLYAPVLSPPRTTCPTHLILLDLIFDVEYRSQSSSLCNLPHPPTSSILDPNISLSTLSLCSSLNVKDQYSHPYKTRAKNNA